MLRGVIDTRVIECSGRAFAGSAAGPHAPMQGGMPEAVDEAPLLVHAQHVKASQPPDAAPDAAAARLPPNGVIVGPPPPLLLPAGAVLLFFSSCSPVAALSGALY